MVEVGESDGGREGRGTTEGGRVMELTHLRSSSPASVHTCSPPFMHVRFHSWASAFIHGRPLSFVDSRLC